MENTINNHSLEAQPLSVISLVPIPTNKINRHDILAKLRELAPISLYSASKKLGLVYTTLKQIVKEFENARLLKTRIMLNSPRAVKIIFFDEKPSLSYSGEQGEKSPASLGVEK